MHRAMIRARVVFRPRNAVVSHHYEPQTAVPVSVSTPRQTQQSWLGFELDSALTERIVEKIVVSLTH